MVVGSVSGAVARGTAVRRGLSPQVHVHAGEGELPSRELGDVNQAAGLVPVPAQTPVLITAGRLPEAAKARGTGGTQLALADHPNELTAVHPVGGEPV